MVGLHYLKHAFDESDESVCDRWVENPYWQTFCGEEYLQHELPIDPSSMTKWRNRVGDKLFIDLLGLTIKLALGLKLIRPKQLTEVAVDTTVQPKAIAQRQKAEEEVDASAATQAQTPQRDRVDDRPPQARPPDGAVLSQRRTRRSDQRIGWRDGPEPSEPAGRPGSAWPLRGAGRTVVA